MCDSALKKHAKGALKYSQREADRGVGKRRGGSRAAEWLVEVWGWQWQGRGEGITLFSRWKNVL